jgi:IclR family acetate operon transcriptional repressor
VRNRDRLLEEVQRVREVGYAVDDQESTPGVRCVAVALMFDHQRSAAFSLSIPVQRGPLDRLHELAPQLLQAAAEIRARVSRSQSSGDARSWNLGMPRA